MKNQRGFVHIVVVVAISLVAVLMLTVAVVSEQGRSGDGAGVVNTAVNQNTNTNADVTTVDTSDWLTYENSEWGFSFKYPEEWSIIRDLLWKRVNLEETSPNDNLYIGLDNNTGVDSFPRIILLVNTDGFGPLVPDVRYYVEKSDDGFKVNREEEYTTEENWEPGFYEILAVDEDGKYKIFFDTKDSDETAWAGTVKTILSTFQFTTPTTLDTSDWLTYENEEVGVRFSYPGNWLVGNPNPGLNADPTTLPSSWEYIVIPVGNGWISYTRKADYFGIYEAAFHNTFYSKPLDYSSDVNEIKTFLSGDFGQIVEIKKSVIDETTVVEFYELGLYGEITALVYRVMQSNETFGNVLGTYVIENDKYDPVELDESNLKAVKEAALRDIENVENIAGDYKVAGEAVENIARIIASVR